ncbi:MAG: tetratricopeptide repeat protein, partial [Bacteroidetes bacterium]|nr:tetratricopeptide repeat protein [Bacteroidota bacterium]
MNRSAHLTLWLVMLSCGVCTAQSNQYDPAPLLRQLAVATSDTARIPLLTALGDFYLEKSGAEPSDMDSALLLLREAKALCIRTGNRRGAELADYYIGWTLVDAEDHAGLLRLFPTLSDTTRIHVLMRTVDDLLNPPDRTWDRMDTVHLFIRQVLALNKNSTLVNQLQVLVKCAVIDYCNRHLYTSTPPSPAMLSDLPHLFDWMTIQIWQDTALVADLQALRLRWAQEKDRIDQSQLRNTIRSTMVYVLSDEAQNNAYHHWQQPAGKEFELALSLDSTATAPDIDLYGYIARWYLNRGALQKALRYALPAVHNIEEHRSGANLAAITRAYLVTGIIYYDLHDPALALTYLQRSVAIVREAGLEPDVRLLATITNCYLALDQPHVALSFLHTTINGSLWQDGVYKEQISESFGECYFALGQYDDAERWYLSSWEVARHRGHHQQMQSSFYLGKLYTRTGQYEKARGRLSAIAADSGKAEMPIAMLQDTHYLLFQLDSATGNYISAIHHLQVFRTLNDSIFDDTRNQQIEDLTFRYAAEKKDRDLQRLNDQALLQQATLRQNNILRNA